MSDLQDVPLASLDLLRQLTDRHVIDQLLSAPAMTRAEIASRTGISKPTISESVRRLAQAGVLVEAGQQVERPTGPGGGLLRTARRRRCRARRQRRPGRTGRGDPRRPRGAAGAGWRQPPPVR